MLALIKNDLYENKFNFRFCLLVAFALSFVLLYFDINLKIKKLLQIILLADLFSLIFSLVLTNVLNCSYKDLLKYPVSKIDIISFKFFELILLLILSVILAFLVFFSVEFLKENAKILFISAAMLIAYSSFIIPIGIFLADKSQGMMLFVKSLAGASFGFILSFIINSDIDTMAIINKDTLLIILSIIFLILSYMISILILSKKEF